MKPMKKAMKRSLKLSVYEKHIPKILKDAPRWVLYRNEPTKKKLSDGSPKMTKKPISPHNGYVSDATEFSTWATFSEAVDVLKSKKHQADGIGFALTDEDDIFVIDIDDCFINGKPNKLARNIMKTVKSYTEISPSGKGLHIFARGKIPVDGKKNSKRGLEIYSNRRYFTVTGNVIGEYKKINKRPKEGKRILRKYFDENPEAENQTKAVEQHTDMPFCHLTLEEIIQRIHGDPVYASLFDGKSDCSDESKNDYTLLKKLAYWCGKDSEMMDSVFRKSALFRKKWDEKRGNTTYGQRTIKKAINDQPNVYDPTEYQNGGAATILLKLAEEKGAYFHDEHNECFGRILVGNHFENWPLSSSNFKTWLNHIYWNSEKQIASNSVVNAVVGILEGKARFEGKQRQVHLRIAHDKAAKIIWYDLSDPEWRAVKITPEGWEIVNNPGVIFRRHSHMAPQVEPVKGGDALRLLDFVNMKTKADELLFMVQVVSWFFPKIDKPIALTYGEHGSAKSTFGRIIRSIVDPSAIPLVSLPTNTNEIIEQLHMHYALIYDNVSGISNAQSDLFCRAVTGAGSQKRKLYSDSDTIIYKFKRCIGLNGINNDARNADLLSRCIINELAHIDRKKRKSETEFAEEFERAKPEILGGIFDVISNVLGKKKAKVNRVERLSDFTLLGCWIAKALGYKKLKFLRAFRRNLKNVNTDFIEGNPLAKTIVSWWRGPGKWQITQSNRDWMMADDFLKTLEIEAGKIGIDTTDKHWPKNASQLGRQLRRMLPNLEEAGFSIVIERVKAGTRYTFSKI